MKKNKMMRLASVLLVCVLLTTSVISGTFAKYVTSDSASDTARVAKFGVVVTASGSLYDKNYVYKTAGNTPAGAETTNLTVESSNTENLVAPGTQNDTGLTFSITGKPEVAVKLEVKLTDAAGNPIDVNDDIYLKANGALPDMTTGDDVTFNNANDYYPVVFTLKKSGDPVPVAEGKLADIAAYMNGAEMNNALIAANTDLGTAYGTYTLTWKWDFDASGVGTYDKQDTLLGDLAAGPISGLTEGTDYNLKSSVKVSITVTQVD